MRLGNILKSTSKKSAIFISYASLLLSTFSSIFLTRILLQIMGSAQYGLYQMIYSVAHYVMILDMGISTVMIRYMSEYRAKGDLKGEQNVAAIVAILVAAASVIVVAAGFVIRANIAGIYTTLTPEEVEISQTMILIMTAQFVLTIYSHYLHGSIQSREYFAFTSFVGAVDVIVSFGMTALFAWLGMGCVGIALANLLAVLLLSTVESYVLFGRIRFRVKLTRWDWRVIRPIGGLMLAMLLQSVVGHVNSFVDKTLLGMFCRKEDVTVYSLSATVLTMVNTLPGIVSGFFQPQVTRMIVKKASASELTDLVIRVGRWQFILLGAVLGAFGLFGRHFVTLWAGEEFAAMAWLIVMIIIVPNMVPLIQSVCISIMNGYDKRLYRSLILAGMTVLNVILSVILIRRFGPLGAPVGTAIAYILGDIFALNIYYAKRIHLEVGRMFRAILHKTWLAVIGATALSAVFLLIPTVNLLTFLGECVGFVAVYGVLLYFFALNTEEKNFVRSLIRRLLKMA